MDEQNPIKYSDLIQPDDSIEKLITQLEQLDKTYNGVVNDMKAKAQSLIDEMKRVSGANEEQRKTLSGIVDEASRVTVVHQKTTEAQRRLAIATAQLKAEQREEANTTKYAAQMAREKAGSYNYLSAQYSLNKQILNKLTAEERANNAEAKKLEEETKAIYEEMKRLQEATGKFSLNVGNYEKSITSALGAQSKWFKGLQELGALFGGGFSDGVKAAGTAVAGFGKQLLALLANPIVATIAAITAAFMALAKGISSSEENTNTLMRVLAPFQRILTGIVDLLQTAAGWLLKGVEGMESLAMGAARLLEKLPGVGSAFKKVNDALEENIRLTREKQELELKERQTNVDIAKLERHAAKLRKDAASEKDEKKRLDLLRRADATERTIALKRVDIAREDLRIKRMQAQQAGNNKEANDALAQSEINLYNAETAYYSKTTGLAKQIRKLTTEKSGGGGGSRKTAAVTSAEDEAKELERIRKEKDKRELQEIRKAQDAQAQLIENEYDRQRVQTELRYDRQIQDLKAQMAELGDDEVNAKKAINAQIIALEELKWKKLAEIADQEMKKATDEETKDLEWRLKATDKLIAGQKMKAKRKEKQDIYDLLGFKLNDEQKAAIDDSVQYALDSLQVFMDAWMEAADAKREKADEEVERAQNVLDAEIEARNQGYAFNVAQAQKELDMAKRNQQKAIKEQQKAQKAQEAIQTAQQVSSLITATANIWSQFTSMGPWGIAAAIAATALMFGSFIASKAQARNAAGSASESYGEGTVELLEGGSHQSGNDIDLGTKKDGTRRRAEGGEYFAVINKRNSRKYGGLIPEVINALNTGTFADKYMTAYGGGQAVTVNVGQAPDISRLADDVHTIRKQGESERYVDGRGNTVMQYKNLRRTIKAS